RRMQVSEDALDERRARRNGEELGQVVPQPVANGDCAVGAPNADVDVEAEPVVAPDDVTEVFVVGAVVRRVDDPLLLPGAPRVRPNGRERDADAGRELVELRPAFTDLRGSLREALAAAGPDLDLGRDQLPDEVVLERRTLRRGLKPLEAVRERQRLGVEDCELLLDRQGEVLAVLERLVRGADLLVWAEPLGVPHLVPLPAIHAGFWPAITRRQSPPSLLPRLPA